MALHSMKEILPIELIYGGIATAGGIARYLLSYTQGQRFSFNIFIASAFVAGFSGYMFALLGQSMSLPDSFVFMMAGVGGFAGEQTMKLLIEITTKRVGK